MTFVNGILCGLVAVLGAAVGSAHAAPFVVNATNGRTNPVSTIALVAGQSFTVTADLNDLWSIGPLPRWSNADGLVGNRFATGTDESGEVAGTLIGQSFGDRTDNGLTSPFGVLAATISGGTSFFVGTNLSGVAATSGILELYCVDSIPPDNANSITANVSLVTVVPEASALALLPLGLVGIGIVARRRAA